MNKFRKAAWMVAVVVLTFASTSVRATLVKSSAVNLQGRANLYGFNTKMDDEDSAAQASTLNPLSAQIDAIASVNDEFVHVTGDIAATWNNAEQGEVTFSDLGWSMNAIFANPQLFLDGFINQPDNWNYTFVLEQDSFFVLDWDIQKTPDTSNTTYLQPFVFTVNDLYQHLLSYPMELDTSGSISQLLLAGVEYTVYLGNTSNVTGGSFPTQVSKMNAGFDWKIINANTPVPGTVPLVLIGIICTWRFRFSNSSDRTRPGTADGRPAQ